MLRFLADGPNQDGALAFLSHAGETSLLIRSMDWSATALGPISSWQPALRVAVSACLASNLPMSIIWGPGHIQIYNDAYAPLCGAKHPGSMGRDYRECWAAAWDVLVEPFGCALGGCAALVENQRVFLDRQDGLEEVFYSFSMSPIRDDEGSVVGVLHPAIDTTSVVLSERRARAIGALTSGAGDARSILEALSLSAQALAAYDFDLPFVLLYTLRDGAREARLVASAGLNESSLAMPITLDLRAADCPWPIQQALASAAGVVVEDLGPRLGAGPHGPYPESPRRAIVMAISPPGAARSEAVLVAGVSSRLILTDAYMAFYDLVAARVTSAVSSALVRERDDASPDSNLAAREQAEEALRRAHDELEATNAKLRAEIAERKRAERARTALLRQLATAQEDERRRVARDLHDSIGQVVTGLSLALEAAASAADLPAASRARLAEARRVADALGREVHDLALRLRPASLDDLGLEAAVQDLVNAWALRTGVRTECAISLGRTRLTHEIETTLYRVVQEALTNVAKHAQASVVSVVFTRVEGYVTAVVEDDGKGFDPAETAAGRLGLLGMRERTSLVGGELDIESKPGWGTTMLVRIPLPEGPDATRGEQ